MDTETVQRLHRFLADPAVPKAAKDQAVAFARQEAGESKTTTPTTTGDLAPRLLRAAPAVAGAIKGAQTGVELGAELPLPPPWGPVVGGVVGAGLGAMPPEAALYAGQHLLGLPQGQGPVLPRVAQAGREAMKGELFGQTFGPLAKKGLEAAGQYGERLASRIGLPRRYGITTGTGERAAAGMAETPGATGVVTRAARRQTSEIARAGQQVLDEFGETELKQSVTRKATHAMRQAMRDLMTRGVRKGPEDYPGAGPLVERLPKRIGYLGRGVAEAPGETSGWIEQHIAHTIHEANVAERLAAHPGAFDELARRAGRPVADETRRAWWTAKLIEATGTKGLQKGVLDAQKIIDDFDGHPAAWREQQFGQALPQVTRFIDTLRGLPLGGAVPEKVKPIPWSTIGAALLSLNPARAGRALAGATIGRAIPFLVAKALTTPQGAEYLANALTSRGLSTAAQVAPAVVRAGAQAVTQTRPPPPPDVPAHVQVPP